MPPGHGGRLVTAPSHDRGGLRLLSIAQGITYVATGAWPLLSMRTFQMVTGPKRDDWLVRTVGGLAVAMGSGMIAGRDRPATVRPFAVAGAITFIAADVIGVASVRLRPVYLLDAAVQSVFLAGWLGQAAAARLRSRGVDERGDRSGAGQDRRAHADPLDLRREVHALHAEAEELAARAWPRDRQPAPVAEALRRLERATEQLDEATRDGAAGLGPADRERLGLIAAEASVDASSVQEAAYLVSS
jgi:hypothetical protein